MNRIKILPVKLTAACVSVLLSSFSVLPGQAQQRRQLQINPEAPVAACKEPKAINSKIDLPDLPEFTGHAKLEKGIELPANDQVERTYAFVYQAREEASRIIDWYRTALAMYRWDIESSAGKAILATNARTGNSCSIYCDNESASGCKLHVSYTFMQKPGQTTAINY